MNDGLPDQVRAFVAVELPTTALEALAQAQSALAAQLDRIGARRAVRWVNPTGIHLTLKFLGNTPSGLLSEIETRLASTLAGRPEFSLELSGLGVFPSARATRVLWVGLAGELPALGAVQRLVEEAVSPLGYPTEARPFVPHLTLGRVSDSASLAERQAIGEVVQKSGPPPVGRFAVSEVSLIRSELSRSGARYSRLFAVSLSGGS